MLAANETFCYNTLMLAKVHSAFLQGLEAQAIEIEVNITPGFPKVTLVGLPDTAVKESRERVEAAIVNSGFSSDFV